MTERKLRVTDWAAAIWIFAVILAFLSPARPAFAQSSGGAGVLTGTVVDASDKKGQGDVVVTATSPAAQGEQVVVTDNTGFYRIPDLPSGVYSLRFEKDGYQPYSRDGIQLRSDTTLRVNADLLPTNVKADEVVVVAKAPTVDVGSSSTGQNITSDFTRRVPVATPGAKGSSNRSFESVAEVTPGAQADQYGVSVAGTSSPENGYVIDGLSVGNPGKGTIGTALSTEFVKEVNVISGGYMPEYGRTMGGVLNAITKTGSNEFHGGAFSYYTPGGLAGTPRVVHQPIDSVIGTSPLNYSFDIGADVGGPILKDKLWFYVGFDYSTENYHVDRTFWHQVYDSNAQAVRVDAQGNPITQHIDGMDQHFYAVSQTLQAIGKLTYAVNDDNKLTATFIAAPTTTGGTNKFSIDPLRGGPETDASGFGGTYSSLARRLSSAAYDTNLKWSTEFDNKKVLIDTIAGWHHQYNDILPSDGTLPGSGQGTSAIPNANWNQSNPSYHGLEQFEPGFDSACRPPPGATVSTLCPVPTYYSGGPLGQIAQQTFDRYTLGSTLTYLFQGLGHHVAKVGFSVEYTTWDHVKAHSGGTNVLENANGVLADSERFGVLIGPDNPVSLEPFRLTTKSIIGGGFIQDSWSVVDRVTVNAGLRYDVQSMYGGSGQLGLTMPNEWSPRLGVIYDPTQEGRAKIFGNFARYYENIPLGLADGSLTGEPSILASYKAGCTTSSIVQPPYCQNAANRGTATNPYTPSQKWGSFGAGATPIDPNIQPTSTNEIVLGGEYEFFKDARGGLSYTHRWIDHWVEDMSHDNRQTFFLGNPGYGIGSDYPKAVRDYDALTLYFMKTFGDDWLTSASYTVSYLRGNIGGLFNANGELDPNHNADFDTKVLMINSTGPLPGDHTHDIKVFGAKDWKLDKNNGLSTGLAFRAKSGGPIDFFGADDPYGTGLHLLLPRGSGGRLPWNYDIDMNAGYRFSFDKDRTISLTMDIFNLFNFQEVTSVDENYTQAVAIGRQNGTLNNVTIYPGAGAAARPLNLTDKNPNFLSPTGFQTPRQFRFGLRGTF